MDPPLRPAARAPLPRADSVVGPLNVTPPEPLTVDQLIEPSQARSRLETVVGPRVFAVSAKLTGERHTVAVPLKAKWQALLSILTGRFLEVGDSAFADVKEQTVQASTNIGLLSALLVAIAVQFILEAAVAPNGNGYINTYPYAWVGQLYFVMMTAAGMALFLSTSASILTVVVLNETESLEEARCGAAAAAAHIYRRPHHPYLFLIVWRSCSCSSHLSSSPPPLSFSHTLPYRTSFHSRRHSQVPRLRRTQRSAHALPLPLPRRRLPRQRRQRLAIHRHFAAHQSRASQ